MGQLVSLTKTTGRNNLNKIPKSSFGKIIYQKIIEMKEIMKYLIISSINGLKSPLKKTQTNRLDQKMGAIFSLLQEINFTYK